MQCLCLDDKSLVFGIALRVDKNVVYVNDCSITVHTQK